MRVLDLCSHFKLRAVCIINKSDLNPIRRNEIRSYMKSRGIEVVGELPYSELPTRAILQGKTICELPGSDMRNRIKALWARMEEILREDCSSV